MTVWFFPILLAAWAVFEEFIFRLFPLVAAVEEWGRSKKIFLIVGLASGIFGLAHGDFLLVFVQGGLGVLLSLLFLKCGGLQKKYGKAFAVTSACHILVNSSIAVILLSGGVKNF